MEQSVEEAKKRKSAEFNYFFDPDSEEEEEDDDWEESETIDAIDDTKTVFISSEFSAMKRAELEQHGITHVLTIAEESDFKFKKVFKHKQIFVMDVEDTPLILFFEECFEFIESALKEGKILIHCVAGASRSATICIAYLMKKNKLSFEEALNHLQKRRPVVDPNPGFAEQLKLFEKMKFSFEGNSEHHFEYKKNYVVPNSKLLKNKKRKV